MEGDTHGMRVDDDNWSNSGSSEHLQITVHHDTWVGIWPLLVFSHYPHQSPGRPGECCWVRVLRQMAAT